MTMKSADAGGRFSPAEELKQYYYLSVDQGAVEYVPHLLVEAKIDFSDVRSGFHMTDSISGAVGVYPEDPEMLLTEDMVMIIDPAKVMPEPPAAAVLQPIATPPTAADVASAESRFIDFLLRCYKAKVFRNFALNIYSMPGESAEDFRGRCLEKLNEPYRKELDGLCEVVNRKMELLKQKHIASRGEPAEPVSESLVSLERGRIREVWEGLTEMFLRAELTRTAGLPRPDSLDSSGSDLEERLASVGSYAVQETRRLQARYREQAANIDEYIIHPNLKDVHLGRTSILWVPVKGQSR